MMQEDDKGCMQLGESLSLTWKEKDFVHNK